MVITASAIALLVVLLAPILLIRFRKRWVAAFNLAVTNRITSRFAARLPGFGILAHVGRKVRQGLPDTSECFPSAGPGRRFAGQPQASIWEQATGHWSEW
jgi:hypothetical protein